MALTISFALPICQICPTANDNGLSFMREVRPRAVMSGDWRCRPLSSKLTILELSFISSVGAPVRSPEPLLRVLSLRSRSIRQTRLEQVSVPTCPAPVTGDWLDFSDALCPR